MTYPNAALTAVCELLMDDFELSQGDIALLAMDIPDECQAMADGRAEAAQEQAAREHAEGLGDYLLERKRDRDMEART